MHIINTLYHNILDGYNHIKTLQIYKENQNITKNSLVNIFYFPKEIQRYINSHMNYKINYHTIINKKNININLYFVNNISNTKITIIINKILLIIYVLDLYADKSCSKNLNIDIYFTHFKRELPKNSDEIFGPIHVNGGYSSAGCNNTGNITIYREEEWYKVLIHELFHNFNLDFATMNINIWKKILKQKIGIQSMYDIFETYCETWARILNVMIVSFFEIINSKKTNNYTSFLSKFQKLMSIELTFSIMQSNKIIKYYVDSKNEYRENTNTLCYYVFTAALIYNYKEFLKWCNIHSKIKFKHTKNNVDGFLYLILKNYYNPQFIEAMQISNKIKINKYKKSLRMSITE